MLLFRLEARAEERHRGEQGHGRFHSPQGRRPHQNSLSTRLERGELFPEKKWRRSVLPASVRDNREDYARVGIQPSQETGFKVLAGFSLLTGVMIRTLLIIGTQPGVARGD